MIATYEYLETTLLRKILDTMALGLWRYEMMESLREQKSRRLGQIILVCSAVKSTAKRQYICFIASWYHSCPPGHWMSYSKMITHTIGEILKRTTGTPSFSQMGKGIVCSHGCNFSQSWEYDGVDNLTLLELRKWGRSENKSDALLRIFY